MVIDPKTELDNTQLAENHKPASKGMDQILRLILSEKQPPPSSALKTPPCQNISRRTLLFRCKRQMTWDEKTNQFFLVAFPLASELAHHHLFLGTYLIPTRGLVFWISLNSIKVNYSLELLIQNYLSFSESYPTSTLHSSVHEQHTYNNTHTQTVYVNTQPPDTYHAI